MADAGQEARLVERLLDEIEGADLDGRDRHLDVAVPGDQNDRRGEAVGLETVDQFEAGHAGHAHVRHDAVEARTVSDRIQKAGRRRKARRLDVLAGKIELE